MRTIAFSVRFLLFYSRMRRLLSLENVFWLLRLLWNLYVDFQTPRPVENEVKNHSICRHFVKSRDFKSSQWILRKDRFTLSKQNLTAYAVVSSLIDRAVSKINRKFYKKLSKLNQTFQPFATIKTDFAEKM